MNPVRSVEVETAGDNDRDLVEVLVDLGWGRVVRITITPGNTSWHFMTAGSTREPTLTISHDQAEARS